MPGSADAATTYQIVDFATGDVTTVIPEAKSYISMNFKSLRAQMPEREELEKASSDALGEISAKGRKETIAGLPCEVYVFTKRPDDEWCITTSLGHVLGFDDQSGAAGVRNPMSVDPAMSRALSRFKDGALALRMTVRSNAGRPTMIVATKVDRTPPPASLFTVPSDYEQVKNPMMPKP